MLGEACPLAGLARVHPAVTARVTALDRVVTLHPLVAATPGAPGIFIPARPFPVIVVNVRAGFRRLAVHAAYRGTRSPQLAGSCWSQRGHSHATVSP